MFGLTNTATNLAHNYSIVNGTVESAIWGLIAQVTGTGKA